MMTDTMTRIDNAYNGLIELLAENGAGDHARDVADLYIGRKLVKLDANIGRYQLMTGDLLDGDVIKTAIEIVDLLPLDGE